jgi:type I restriction enzyme M protein
MQSGRRLGVGMTISGRQLFDELWSVYTQKMASQRMSALDYAELVTYLLFLKIDDERSQRRVNRVRVVSEGLGWQTLFHKTGQVLEDQFGFTVSNCGRHDPDPGSLIRQTIFEDAVPSLRCSPSALSHLMTEVVNGTRWSEQRYEDLHDMYALLMVEASADFKIASGQTLTPWPLVSAVIDCLRPTSSDVVLDPACGTGSILVAAHRSMAEDGAKLEAGAVSGADFDPTMCRFATMNYLLSTGAPFDSTPPVKRQNSLAEPETRRPSMVVCNPPFKSVAPLPEGRIDLTRSGSMQLNFLQHIARGLPVGGRAAVFVPDNILFGSGANLIVRRWLLQEYDVHTLLRLPTGVFASGGVKTNVIFFDAVRQQGDGSAATGRVWIYDFRSGLHFAARDRPLARKDLQDFVACYGHGAVATARTTTEKFKPVSYRQLEERQFNLDILWPDEGDPGEVGSPKSITLEIVGELEAALAELKILATELPDDSAGVEP